MQLLILDHDAYDSYARSLSYDYDSYQCGTIEKPVHRVVTRPPALCKSTHHDLNMGNSGHAVGAPGVGTYVAVFFEGR